MLTEHQSGGKTVWVDLCNPTNEEIGKACADYRTDIPPREQLEEIEFSSRLQYEDETFTVSVPVTYHNRNGGEDVTSPLVLQRAIPYVAEHGEAWMDAPIKARLKMAGADAQSLNEYEVHLTDKIQFLLDADLGFISTEQNDIFKVLTIASVVGIPPVLVAGVYGMNFHFMPELAWPYGYPYGLALIVVSALLPLWWFKRKGWCE